MRRAVFVLCSLAAAAASWAASPTPLLDYALSQNFEIPLREPAYQRRLSGLLHELERNSPPETGCAQTLGAKRFADLYDDLGKTRSNLADYDGAVEAFEKALTCTPRAAYLYAELTDELTHLNRYVEARAIAEQGLAIDPDEESLNRVLARLEYIEEHWGEAARRVRSAVAALKDDDTAGYWQCLLWLAQRHAGIERPQLVSSKPDEEWPQTLLAALEGEIGEPEVLAELEDEDDANRRRELLAEALFYLGERRLAQGSVEEGSRYLAATVNLKVHYFIEHHLALAQLAKRRARRNAVD